MTEPTLLPPIQKCALTPIPCQSFADWIDQLYPNEKTKLEELHEQGFQTYLIPNFDKQDDLEKFLKENFIKVFKNELQIWDIDPSDWPILTYELFCDWFALDFSDMVFALG
jgi:hypothetical protein